MTNWSCINSYAFRNIDLFAQCRLGVLLDANRGSPVFLCPTACVQGVAGHCIDPNRMA
mgnify:CR=1 FL=1